MNAGVFCFGVSARAERTSNHLRFLDFERDESVHRLFAIHRHNPLIRFAIGLARFNAGIFEQAPHLFQIRLRLDDNAESYPFLYALQPSS